MISCLQLILSRLIHASALSFECLAATLAFARQSSGSISARTRRSTATTRRNLSALSRFCTPPHTSKPIRRRQAANGRHSNRKRHFQIGPSASFDEYTCPFILSNTAPQPSHIDGRPNRRRTWVCGRPSKAPLRYGESRTMIRL